MKLDSFDKVLTWLQAVLLDIVAGIKGTYHYWNRKSDEIEALAD